MGGLGMPEIAVILGILIIVFGVKRLPQIGKDIGAGLREFKKAGKEIIGGDEDDDKQVEGDTNRTEKPK